MKFCSKLIHLLPISAATLVVMFAAHVCLRPSATCASDCARRPSLCLLFRPLKICRLHKRR